MLIRTFCLAVFTLLFLGCSDDDTDSANPLLGAWQMTEQLVDPGDGSGEFRPVDTGRRLRFYEDGALESLGTLCFITTNDQAYALGNYNLAQRTIQPLGCENYDSGAVISFELDGNTLILNYPCIEPCAQKYVRE
ncbi:hypothetical protein [Robertkochia aurantiaca]|uniref:hypothetical protein n=1 Tax=Robertkochia aurantiaca TaxID=2873700 RepID=UPI001CCFF650|nr:hypothetical protein [Robertkochia sp. 3YJGBD-33]